jgi:hypothetical protein
MMDRKILLAGAASLFVLSFFSKAASDGLYSACMVLLWMGLATRKE